MKAIWDQIGLHPHHGINVPLFSLRSEKGCGVGSFLDLIPLIDWCKSVSFDTIQLLPVNDSGLDSSPYNALSSVALNPIYLSLESLPFLEEYPDLQTKLLEFAPLNLAKRFHYQTILLKKLDFLRIYHKKAFPRIQNKPSFLTFCEEHLWVKTYSLFKALKEAKNNTSLSSWEDAFINPTHAFLEKLTEEYQETISFYTHIQFLAFEQLKTVKEYASQKNIFLKGDIPILISPDSHDVWLEPEIFNLDYSAGAPPDMFNPNGQSWGFPIYEWDVIEKTEFAWWRRRLKVASEFYHMFRIDHILGLYRIWAIAKGAPPRTGAYRPHDPKEAITLGESILSRFSSFTSMLPIGEDLGIVTDGIRASMEKLGIPGTRVPRWERYYSEDSSFIPYHLYPPLSLTTLSTHDSETLGEWWALNPDEAKDFAQFSNIPYARELSYENRLSIITDSHQTASLLHINLLQEYLALFPELVHPHPKEERINIPGTMSSFNWTYRFRPTIREIVSHEELSLIMSQLSQKMSTSNYPKLV